MMDGSFELDLEEVIECVGNAEVMSLFFPTFGKSVVIDTRSTLEQGPMVRIVPIVASPQERLHSLRRLRPGFPRLRSLTVIPWPRYVNSLVTHGIWDRIVGRFVEAGQDNAVGECETVLSELRRLEKAELAAVVTGENYSTVWSSTD